MEDTWDYWSLFISSYLLMSWQSGCLKHASLNVNVRCLYIIVCTRWNKNCCLILFWWIFILLYFWSSWKCFVETLGNIFHVNSLGYEHWFISIRISQTRDYSISVDQARYATYIVVKYLDNATVKTINKFYNTNLPSDMIFTKYDAYTSDEQVEKLTI